MRAKGAELLDPELELLLLELRRRSPPAPMRPYSHRAGIASRAFDLARQRSYDKRKPGQQDGWRIWR
jgi:hypothetical protein